ncbi:MAG TPA: hypothetical protein VMZ05_07895 [Spirochaetota bacterium]|nr:hypothetical protein [Spirochaetota bacterium]
MENQQVEIDNRVFHIDDECYIVYVGTDRDDYKPFLRIGNSSKLTQKIISHVYNIVVTDSYTGNPALEAGNINKRRPKANQYVGDRQTVGKFLEFLKNYIPETDKISQYRDVSIKEHGALASFYDDGNVQLYFDKKLIFGLKGREKKDLHFVERTKLMADQLSRDTLRYLNADFKDPGFFVAGGAALLFNRERLIAVGLPDDYFAALVRCGIDPDLISGIMTEDVTEPVIQLFKRKKYRREQLVVFTMNVGLLQNAVDLFASFGREPLKSRVVDLRKGKKEELLEYSISSREARLLFAHKRLPFTISFSALSQEKEENLLTIDPKRNTLLLKGSVSRLAEGIPYIFDTEVLSGGRMVQTYFSELLPFFSSILSPGELIVTKHLEKFLGDVEADSRFTTSFKSAKNGLRKAGKNPSPCLFFLLSNAKEICRLLGKEKAVNPDASGALGTVKGRILKAMRSFESVAVPLPIVCRVHVEDETVTPLYVLTKDTVTHDEYTVSLDTKNSIEEKRTEDALFYQEEEKRLNALFEKLNLPPPPEEKKQVLEGEETDKTAQKTGVPSQKTAEGKKKKNVRRIGIALGAVAVVAAVLLLLFFFREKEGEKKAGEIASDTASQGEILPESTETPETAEGATAGTAEPEPITPDTIRITLLDIYLLTNRIARDNSFRELDSPAQLGRDPNWIYPGNVFTLPDGAVYTVIDGDTIWYIATRFIRKTLHHDWILYSSILKEIEKTGAAADDREKQLEALIGLKNGSYSENFRKEVDKTISGLRD